MQLVADRFAVDEDGRAFDLATGVRIALNVGVAGGVTEQVQWTDACAERRRVHDRAEPRLVDFGLVGETQRFEAIERRGNQLLVAGSDYPQAIRLIEQPGVRALAEMFGAATGGRPQVASLWGPAGSGKGVFVGELARIARTRGFVPVAARLIGSPPSNLWKDRSLFLIANRDEDDVWEACLDAALRDPVPHVILLVGEEECRSVRGVALQPMSVDALVAAIEPGVLGGRLEKPVRRAAERSQGWPGRFARLLWTEMTSVPQPRRSRRPSELSRVAEQAAVYGVEPLIADPFETVPVPCAWPAPGELATLRRKMAQAVEFHSRGRHAAGIRQLRQVIGSFARRGAWSDAAQGGVKLASALLRRGRPRDALSAIEDARQYAVQAGEQPTLLDLAVLGGEAWIDCARLDEADSILGTALAAARGLEDPERLAAVSMALARTSYWRGDYADAEVLLASVPDAAATRERRLLLGARVAAAQGDVTHALSLIGAASERTAASAYVTGLVHAAVGDLAAAERDVNECLALARSARDPQRAVRARCCVPIWSARAVVLRPRSRSCNASGGWWPLRRRWSGCVGSSPTRWPRLRRP